MPLVDPITRQKVKFNPEIFKDGLFTTDMAMKEWGGDCNFEYVHQSYWEDLVKMCATRSTTWKENWRKLGGTIGISEWSYKIYNNEKAEGVADQALPSAVETPDSVEIAAVAPGITDSTTKKVEAATEGHQAPAPTPAQTDTSLAATVTADAVAGVVADASSGGNDGAAAASE